MKILRTLPWLFLAAFVFTVIRDYARELTPTSHWFEVNSVQVFDAKEGTPPKMAVIRSIKSQFVGEWVASVRRVTADGLELVCLATGKSDYVPGARYPEELDLKWWMGKDCPLTHGSYLLDTTWVIMLDDDYGRRTVTTRSNVFNIKT